MKFTLRLVLAFILSPLMGALVANVPSALLISLLAENGGGGYGSYTFLTFAALLFAYPMMLPGIVIIGFYARNREKWYLYALTGALLGIIGGFPVTIFLAEKEILAICLLITLILNGVCVGLSSYFIMQRPPAPTPNVKED